MPEVKAFFEQATSTLTYVVYNPETLDAVIIDPVLDFDAQQFQTSTESLKKLLTFVEAERLKVHFAIDTHVHADHLTGAHYLRKKLGCQTVMSRAVCGVQRVFAGLLDLPEQLCDGSQFDILVTDGEQFKAGSITVVAIATPGHTPACTTYRIGDAIFTGDTLFMPDFGTGRCDFPRGSADDLYTSIHEKLYALPGHIKVYVGHDYQPGGRELCYETTIAESRVSNVHLTANTTREAFVKWRESRDATLAHPKLLYQSLQVNINNGELPSKHANGVRYMVMPLNTVRDTDDYGDALP